MFHISLHPPLLPSATEGSLWQSKAHARAAEREHDQKVRQKALYILHIELILVTFDRDVIKTLVFLHIQENVLKELDAI